jgi:hypothetical protein
MEHGGGSPAAFPVARDMMTWLFDQQKGMDRCCRWKRNGAARRRNAWRPNTVLCRPVGASAPAVDNSEETVESTVAGPPDNAPSQPTPDRRRQPRARTGRRGSGRSRSHPNARATTMSSSTSIIPEPLRRLPWRILGSLGLLTLFGSAVLYSAAGGKLFPWALIHMVHFAIFGAGHRGVADAA